MSPAFRLVGILSRLGGWYAEGRSELATAAAFPSPLSAEDVAAADPVVAAAFGLSTSGGGNVTRAEAMSIPAVKRGRNVICSTIASQPLVALRGVELERVERQLLVQPDPNTTRQYVIAWTLDSLLFYGVAWWLVTDRDATGYPTRAEWLAPGRVMADTGTGTVRVDGKIVGNDRLIRFDGPDEGVLANSATLRTALLLEASVRRNADGLPPLDLLTPQEGAAELTADEVSDLLDAWQEARRTRSTAYINAAVKHQSVGYDAQAAGLSAARTFQIGEAARLLNLPPRYVDAESGASMTYSNVQSERLDLVDLALAPYLEALSQRLSMPDVTPRGQIVRVDMSGFLRGDTKTAVEAGALAVQAGFLEPAEVRADVFNRPPLPERAAPAAPAPEVPSA